MWLIQKIQERATDSELCEEFPKISHWEDAPGTTVEVMANMMGSFGLRGCLAMSGPFVNVMLGSEALDI